MFFYSSFDETFINLLHWSVGFINFPAFVVFVDLLPISAVRTISAKTVCGSKNSVRYGIQQLYVLYILYMHFQE